MSAGRTNIQNKTSWNTPPKYVEAVLEFFDGEIDLDPCSNENSLIPAKVKYILPTDGLKEFWNYTHIFINPPYGRDSERKTSIADWVKKASESQWRHRNNILMLIPVATNTRHWKDTIFKHARDICFLADTRLKFWSNGAEDKKGAPMAMSMIHFGSYHHKFETVFSKYGKVITL